MLHHALKTNIERLLKEKNWKIVDLEKKLEKHSRPINNIFQGTSKNPTIEVIQSIAQAFNVEIQELLIDPATRTSTNLALLREAWNSVFEELEHLDSSISITSDSVFALVKEVYEYSSKLKLSKADINFTKWIIQKKYKN